MALKHTLAHYERSNKEDYGVTAHESAGVF